MKIEEFDDIARLGCDCSLSEAAAVLDAAKTGDVHHIDGPLIAALTDMCSGLTVEYCGAKVSRDTDDTFKVHRGGMVCWETDALAALIEAERTQRPAVQLSEMNGWVAE